MSGPGTLQSTVIRRFMGESEFSKFMKSYSENKKTGRYANREDYFKAPIDPKDLLVTKEYFLKPEMGIKEIAKKFSISTYKVQGIVQRVLIRSVYQNMSTVGKLFKFI